MIATPAAAADPAAGKTSVRRPVDGRRDDNDGERSHGSRAAEDSPSKGSQETIAQHSQEPEDPIVGPSAGAAPPVAPAAAADETAQSRKEVSHPSSAIWPFSGLILRVRFSGSSWRFASPFWHLPFVCSGTEPKGQQSTETAVYCCVNHSGRYLRRQVPRIKRIFAAARCRVRTESPLPLPLPLPRPLSLSLRVLRKRVFSESLIFKMSVKLLKLHAMSPPLGPPVRCTAVEKGRQARLAPPWFTPPPFIS